MELRGTNLELERGVCVCVLYWLFRADASLPAFLHFILCLSVWCMSIFYDLFIYGHVIDSREGINFHLKTIMLLESGVVVEWGIRMG